MIISNIVGGLGNQMFQYAVARALSLSCGLPLKLDISAFETYATHKLLLDNLDVHFDLATPDEIPKRPSKKRKMKMPFWSRSKMKWIEETSLGFNPEIVKIQGPAYLKGYWQSEKYFLDKSKIIRSDFSLKKPLSQSRAIILEQIRASRNPVSVHVRRGDYVTNPSANAIHGTCEPDWYQEAVKIILNSLGEATLFLFSDDPQWAEQSLKFSVPMVLVEPDTNGRDYEDMHLMSACKAHVIANSTFSWWGAWLNPDEHKIVVAPRNWFRSKEHFSEDLIPTSWKVL